VISVALIEDNRLVRDGISVLLNQMTDLRVVAAASTGDISALRQVNPQVVLLDLGLRNGDSLRVAEKVLEEFPQSKVIVMDVLPLREEITLEGDRHPETAGPFAEWSAATFRMTRLAPAGASMSADFLPAQAGLCKVRDGFTHSAPSALI